MRPPPEFPSGVGVVRPATSQEAAGVLAASHYAQGGVRGIRYGWQVDGVVVAVAVYANGMTPTRDAVFGREHRASVLTLQRFAVLDGAPKFTASKFLAASLKRLRRDKPDLKAVVTYADSCEGHVGAIYQATNAIYTGLVAVGNIEFVTADGKVVGTQALHGTWPQRRARAAEEGWVERRCLGKHRYVFLLGRKTPPLRLPTYPCPK